MLSLGERRSYIDIQHEELSVRAQYTIWEIPRSGVYYVPVEINSETLAIMKLIDRVYTAKVELLTMFSSSDCGGV